METLHGLQGLEKRLRAVRLIKEDQAVVSHEPGANGPSSGPASIGAEQETRADLIDG